MTSWEDFSKQLGSYGVGIAESPLDAFRYSTLGANQLAKAIGLRNPEEARSAAVDINNAYDAPFRDYRQFLKEEAPEMNQMGQIAGAILAARGAGSLPVSLLKRPLNAPSASNFQKVIAAAKKFAAKNPRTTAGGLSLSSEGIAEPAIDWAGSR